MFKRFIAIVVIFSYILTYHQPAYSQGFNVNELPMPGTMVGVSSPFVPLALKGLIVNPQKPLEFQFIVDTGKGPRDTVSIKEEANELIKYFLAGLTIPEGELWVNLSPYEKNRIIASSLGNTELGRDLLAQDYILKQLTASLIYPDKDLGKKFWGRVYSKAQKQFGTTNIPVNTFNKVWILPDQAQVFENGSAAYVTKATLKVMLDEDYLAKEKHQTTQASNISSQIVRQIILPEIEKEVNTGKNFAPLRQIYDAMILAKWYKETISNGLLDALYTNRDKTGGISLADPGVKEQIYQRYLQAYKKGVFNFIKEDQVQDGKSTPRKYFSGGFTEMGMKLDRSGSAAMISVDGAMISLTVSLVVAGVMGAAGLAVVMKLRKGKREQQRRIPAVTEVKKIFEDAVRVQSPDEDIVAIVGANPTATFYSAARHTIKAVLDHPITVYYPGPWNDITNPLITTDGDVFLFVDIGSSHISSIKAKINELSGNIVDEKRISATEYVLDFTYRGKKRRLYYYNKTDATKVDALPEKVKEGLDVYIEKSLSANNYGDNVSIDQLLKPSLQYLRDGGFVLTDHSAYSSPVNQNLNTIGIEDVPYGRFGHLAYFKAETEDGAMVTRRKQMLQAIERYKFDFKPAIPQGLMLSKEQKETLLGIQRLERNMGDRQMHDDVLRGFLSNQAVKILVVTDPKTENIVGYSFGLPQIKAPGSNMGMRQKFIMDTFYGMSRQVDQNYQAEGIGSAMRMKLIQMAIADGFKYYAFHQRDTFSQEYLESELRDLYGIDGRVDSFMKNIPGINGGPEQQYVVFKLLDKAMLQSAKQAPLGNRSAENGGIDLNQIKINHIGKTINVQFDQAQLNELEQEGFDGFKPIITNVTRISSPFQLLGIKDTAMFIK